MIARTLNNIANKLNQIDRISLHKINKFIYMLNISKKYYYINKSCHEINPNTIVSIQSKYNSAILLSATHLEHASFEELLKYVSPLEIIYT